MGDLVADGDIRGDSMGDRIRRTPALIVVALLATMLAVTGGPSTASSSSAPQSSAALAPASTYAGLAVTRVLSGLQQPVATRFAPDGRVYIAEKSGIVKVFDSPSDTGADIALDLRTQVQSYSDRGLLGLALDPRFADGRPYLYTLFTYDREPFGGNTSMPRWGDTCPTPPGANDDGCVVSARLVRFDVDRTTGRAQVGTAKVLLDGVGGAQGGWCNQFPSHAIGTIEFGADGMLYAGSGDGASYNAVDYGQFGGSTPDSPTPKNPCNDGPTGRGTAPPPGTSLGGALRSQSVRAGTANGYQAWDGAILRIDPDTGAAPADNPLVGNGRAGDDRIVAYGLRNPYRFSFRPGTDELWLGEVGWGTFEEINRFATGPGQSSVPNFGWPCYEGPGKQGGYDSADIGLCESLYASGDQTIGGVSSPLAAPHFAWPRGGEQPAAGCSSSGGGSATGGVFVTNQAWPTALHGAYVFSDYVRGCIVAMPLTDGQPDPAKRVRIAGGTAAVNFVNGPGADIYFLDIVEGTLNRIRSTAGNIAPQPELVASPEAGQLPLAVSFDARGTTDPNPGDVLAYTWDLDGDGTCDDGTGATIGRTYSAAGRVTVTVCVSDGLATAEATTVIHPGRTAPRVTTMTSTADQIGYAVGDPISISAAAVEQEGAIPATSFEWDVTIQHCTSPESASCHQHLLQTFQDSRSITINGPDHDYYAYLEVDVRATDRQGLVARRTLEIRPRISPITLATEPAGIPVSVGPGNGVSPFVQGMFEAGHLQLLVPDQATVDGVGYTFAGWADGSQAGVRRDEKVPAGARTYTARYRRTDGPPTPPTPTPPTPTPPTGTAYFREHALAAMAGRVLTGDFAGSPADDVLLARRRKATLRISDGSGGFKTTTIRRRALRRAVVGDFVGDARDEILFYGRGGEGRLWRFDRLPRSSTKIAVRAASLRVPRRAVGITLGHERHADEVLWRGRGEQASVLAFRWRGRRLSLISTAMRVPRRGSPRVGDFDGNGTADVLWSASGTGSVWLTGRRRRTTGVVRRLGFDATAGRPLVGDFLGTGRDQFLLHGRGADVVVRIAGRRLVSRAIDTDLAGRAYVVPGATDRVLVAGSERLSLVSIGQQVEVLDTGNATRAPASAIPGDFDGSADGDLLWVPARGRSGPSWLYLR